MTEQYYTDIESILDNNFHNESFKSTLKTIFLEEYKWNHLSNLDALKKFIPLIDNHIQGLKFTLQSTHIEMFEDSTIFLAICNKDQPFLFDSILNIIQSYELEILISAHPVCEVTRNNSGVIQHISTLSQDNKDSDNLESWIFFHLSSFTHGVNIDSLQNEIELIFEDVQYAVSDWKNMESDLTEAIEKLRINNTDNEIIEFCQWMLSGNIVMLGTSFYDRDNTPIIDESAKGILKNDKNYKKLWMSPKCDVNEDQDILISKSKESCMIHRIANYDIIFIPIRKGNELLYTLKIIGLFTANLYYQAVNNIPIIRQKLARMIEESGFRPMGFNTKHIASIFEFFPREFLLTVNEEKLKNIIVEILNISQRPQTKLFLENNSDNTLVSCMLFLPKSNYSTEAKQDINNIISESIGGHIVEQYIHVTNSQFARLYMILRIDTKYSYNIEEIEEEISNIIRPWYEKFSNIVNIKYSPVEANDIVIRYQNNFSHLYQSSVDPELAISRDLDFFEKLMNNENDTYLYTNISNIVVDDDCHIKNMCLFLYYSSDKADFSYSYIFDLFERIGFEVISSDKYDHKNINITVNQFTLSVKKRISGNLNNENLASNITLLITEEFENDELNNLILLENATIRQIMVIRAYIKYMIQIGIGYDTEYIILVLLRYSNIIHDILTLFDKKFIDPTKDALEIDDIYAKLSHIENVAEDNILRTLINLVESTLRTNYALNKHYISFKFDSNNIYNLPLPKPYREIFVYSKHFEGVHLRGGPVSRGGLRWSNRYADFRTEVLGLLKAQMTKNALIVPVGAKGGFVVKKAQESDENIHIHAVECYKEFLSGLLDITDNILHHEVVRDEKIIAYDDEDTYLVVAADKGTASFSDVANSIADKYNFWLGDAFASGGSVGYDHKKMGITAKGAWVSVTKFLYRLNKEVNKDEFTVVGIGDMSGDVFGNGMLLSSKILLVGAFNHIHIFVDPYPNAEVSYQERLRLFKYPRSTWRDYDDNLISKGGGVFDRSQKFIVVTREMKEVFNITEDQLTPDQLIGHILRANVDLLWNGGIGTYIKSSTENHIEVGDKANDAIRIDGHELRAKIVGEGGNLGATQKGRIEYARNGGMINTDFIDNSAGVNCSDREVNIKIAFQYIMDQSNFSIIQRNGMLAQMTDIIEEEILEDNRLQFEAITDVELDNVFLLPLHLRFIQLLESIGLLDRAIEHLPTDNEILDLENKNSGLCRPELAVLLSYSKMYLYSEFLNSKLLESDYFNYHILHYFPKLMRDKFEKQILEHPLRKNIIATALTNNLINRLGPTFYIYIQENSNLNLPLITCLHELVHNMFSLSKIYDSLDILYFTNHHVERQRIVKSLKLFAEFAILWFARKVDDHSIMDLENEFHDNILKFAEMIDINILPYNMATQFQSKIEHYQGLGFDAEVSKMLASLKIFSSSLDIIDLSNKMNLSFETVCQVYFHVSYKFDLNYIQTIITRKLGSRNYWDRITKVALNNELFQCQKTLTSYILESLNKDEVLNRDNIDSVLYKYLEKDNHLYVEYNSLLIELKKQKEQKVEMVIPILRKLANVIK